MSDVGVTGLSGIFKANLLGGMDPLKEAPAGLPWQKSSFESVLYAMLAPADPLTKPVNPSAYPLESQSEPVRKEKQDLDALPHQLSQNRVDFEQRLTQQTTNPMFFNYVVQSSNGHYRTELARNVYNNAMGRAA